MRIRQLSELKDSRIMFDENPPKYGNFLILLFALLVSFAVYWAVKTPKVYVVQANGTITNEELNYVMCTYSGQIINNSLVEGMLVENGDLLFNVKSTDYDLQEIQLQENRQSYQQIKDNYDLLVKSIQDSKNYFDDGKESSEFYYSMYEAYKAQVAQNDFDASTYQAYGYSDDQIKTEMLKSQGKIAEIYYTAIQNATKASNDAQLQIEAIDAQLSALSSGQKEYGVYANATGKLHLLTNYKNGMVVQGGSAVAVIIPENDVRILEAYISTSDMAKIHVQDETKIVVDGLSQNVYGTLTGTVKTIDSYVSSKESADGSTQSVFRIEVAINEDYLVDDYGNKVDIVNGMGATARIQYNKVTWFDYLLDKIGFTGK